MIRSRWIGGIGLLAVTFVLGACGSQWLAGGKLHFDQKRYDRALENFQKAVAEKPNSGEAHLWLGRALAELERDSLAIVELKKARELDPLQDEMVRNTFVSYWSRRYNSALTYAKEGEEAQRAGDTERSKTDMGKSEEQFRRAAEYAPDSVQNYSNLGKILYRQGRREEALAMFHKAKEMSAGRPDLQRFLFTLFKELGENALQDPTRENLKRGLNLLLDASALPADAEALAEVNLNIASIYRGMADSVDADQKPEMRQKAIEYYDKVLAGFPDDTDALEGEAYVYSDLGLLDQAQATGQKRLDLEPWSKDAHLLMYRILRTAKNDKDANAHFLLIQILQDGTPQDKATVRTWAVKEFGPTCDMIKTLRDRGDPETLRTFTPAGSAAVYMWAYWTGGRAYIFQGGAEKYRVAFKAAPREQIPAELLQ